MKREWASMASSARLPAASRTAARRSIAKSSSSGVIRPREEPKGSDFMAKSPYRFQSPQFLIRVDLDKEPIFPRISNQKGFHIDDFHGENFPADGTLKKLAPTKPYRL